MEVNMEKRSQRAATVVAGTLSALVLALPVRGFADQYRSGDHSEWNSGNSYTQRYHDDDDYNRSRNGYDEGQRRRDWQGVQNEREELEQGRNAQRRDWNRLQHEQREMNQARRAGDLNTYRHEQEEAEQAADAVRRDQGQIEHERSELRQQQQAYRHNRNDWNAD
jgi:hypothetical protein